ncbi:MAG: NAD(P)-dependent oxidoreductase [Clostridia bacterium]
MKKILIIDLNGMFAQILKDKLSNAFEVYILNLKIDDVCNKDYIVNKINEVKPYFVINCAEYGDIDNCEINYELAKNINEDLVEYISFACNKIDATLIQMSTNYVFDGSLNISLSYTEDIQSCPITIYGKTKLLGEINAAKSNRYYILRTSWIYGNDNDFVKKIINLFEEKVPVNVVCDQYGNPTSITTIVDILKELLKVKPKYGIYNIANEGFTTWSEFAKDILKLSNLKMKIIAVTTDKQELTMKNTVNSKLSNI